MDSQFAKEIAKQAVARAANALNIDQCDKAAVDALADVLRNFIVTIGDSARSQAESGGRAFPGIQDFIKTLESMRPHPVSWKDLKAFGLEDEGEYGDRGGGEDEEGKRSAKWCQPFPFEVRSFPVELPTVESIDTGLLVDATSTVRDASVPSHLPAYPPTYTYRRAAAKRPHNHDAVDRAADRDREKRVAVTKSARQSLARLEDAVDNVE